jgi:hypothetical protein
MTVSNTGYGLTTVVRLLAREVRARLERVLAGVGSG